MTNNIKLPNYCVLSYPRTSSVALTQTLMRLWETREGKFLNLPETMWASGEGVQLYKHGYSSWFGNLPEGNPPFKLEGGMVAPEHVPGMLTFLHNNNYIPIFIDREPYENLKSFYISACSHFHEFFSFKSRNKEMETPRVLGDRVTEFNSWTLEERMEKMKTCAQIVMDYRQRDADLRKKIDNHAVIPHSLIKDDVTNAFPLLNIKVDKETRFYIRVKRSQPVELTIEEEIKLKEFAELMI